MYVSAMAAVLLLLPAGGPQGNTRTDANSLSANTYAIKQENVCGQYCLASVLRFLGKDVGGEDVLYAIPSSHSGSSLAELKVIAEAYGLRTLGARLSRNVLASVRRPVILHVNGNHFIALLPDRTGGGFVVIDPPRTLQISGADDLAKHWKWRGNCLFIDDKEITMPEGQSCLTNRLLPRGIVILGLVILTIWAGSILRAIRRRVTKGGMSANGLLAGAAVLLGLLISPVPGAENAGVPRIVVKAPAYDAGIVFDDTRVISHAFEVANNGTADLVIEKIKTDCSCTTVVNDEKMRIKPGESLPVTIRFNVSGRFGKLTERKTALITNDPEKPLTTLTINAERRREFTVSPPQILLGAVPLGMEKILFVRIEPGAENQRLEIDKARTSSPFLDVSQVRLESKTTAAFAFLLKVHLLPTAPPGLMAEAIRIPAAGASVKTLEIPVKGEIVGPITISLSQLQFGIVRQGNVDATKRITLRSETPFKITRTSARGDWLKVAAQEIGPKEHSLVVTVVSAIAPKGKLEGVVTIETDDLRMPKIELPVFAFCP